MSIKRKLAENMADFLGYDENVYETFQEFFESQLQGTSWNGIKSTEEIIFSPEGFFAIRTRLIEEIKILKLSTVETINFWERFNYMFGLNDKQLYIQFYSAVYKIMNK